MPAATAWYPVFTDLMLIARHHTAFEKAGEWAQFVAFHLQVRGKEPGRMDKLDWVGKRNCSKDFGTLGSLLSLMAIGEPLGGFVFLSSFSPQ